MTVVFVVGGWAEKLEKEGEIETCRAYYLCPCLFEEEKIKLSHPFKNKKRESDQNLLSCVGFTGHGPWADELRLIVPGLGVG